MKKFLKNIEEENFNFKNIKKNTLDQKGSKRVAKEILKIVKKWNYFSWFTTYWICLSVIVGKIGKESTCFPNKSALGNKSDFDK